MKRHKNIFKKEATKAVLSFLDDIGRYRKALVELKSSDPEYMVCINSYWKNLGHGHEDEKDIMFIGKDHIKDVIRQAEDNFKKTNKRSDVQAHYGVAMKVGEVVIELPEKEWGKYKEKR